MPRDEALGSYIIQMYRLYSSHTFAGLYISMAVKQFSGLQYGLRVQNAPEMSQTA